MGVPTGWEAELSLSISLTRKFATISVVGLVVWELGTIDMRVAVIVSYFFSLSSLALGGRGSNFLQTTALRSGKGKGYLRLFLGSGRVGAFYLITSTVPYTARLYG